MPYYAANNTMTHFHHVIPKHAGGTDDDINLVELTVPDHAEEHRKLYEQHGRPQDRIAWQLLKGEITIREARIAAMTATLNTPKVRRKKRLVMIGKNVGKKRTEEWKRRNGELMKGNHHLKGYKFSKKQKANVSASLKGNNRASANRGRHASCLECRQVIHVGNLDRHIKAAHLGIHYKQRKVSTQKPRAK